MRAEAVLQREFESLKGVIHAQRLAAVFRAIAGALIGSRLTLSGIGRSISSSAHTKHLIKSVDRLLGNVRLHAEVAIFYAALAAKVPREERPVLLIDWTDIGTLWAALVVTVVSEGRGIVIYARVHPRRLENSPRIEARCLRDLRQLFVAQRPILVSDAGFRGPWMRKVLENDGWDFVGRVRGRVTARRVGTRRWANIKSLFWPIATAQPKDLGEFELARYLPVPVRVVLVKKHRVKPLPKIGRRRKHQVRSALEPWVLATSLTDVAPKKIAGLYALRMRIEETFRDHKCPRFGLGLDQARTKKIERITVLLLLAALAHYISMVIGAAAEALRIHRHFQANTVSNRRVLSLARLGREILLRFLITAGPELPWALPQQLIPSRAL
jgi:hypothetical protein